jgi:hypothetical protein
LNQFLRSELDSEDKINGERTRKNIQAENTWRVTIEDAL